MSQLGIDPILIAFQVANFFVLMFVLKKYLYKPVVDTIEKRRANISQTDELRQELEKER